MDSFVEHCLAHHHSSLLRQHLNAVMTSRIRMYGLVVRLGGLLITTRDLLINLTITSLLESCSNDVGVIPHVPLNQ
jgi:hypothetical protein